MARKASAMADAGNGSPESSPQQLPEKPVHDIAPPGVVRGSGHGRSTPVGSFYGMARLRRLLDVSPEVPVDQVAEEAAFVIEKLREAMELKKR